MKNIAEKLNLVIDYIENHLTENIEQKTIEKITCCSYYDITRSFSLITGVNISDYIRKRKLTLAGIELKYRNAKVLDIALKYGYDSPVSFARAFQAFHGFNPSLARKKDTVLNSFQCLACYVNVREIMDALKIEKLLINGKEFLASYYGKQDMSTWSDYATKREFWRLENVKDEFENCQRSLEVLPYNNYPPIHIEIGQVFVVDYHTLSGKIDRLYYVADGTVWHNLPCTRKLEIG